MDAQPLQGDLTKAIENVNKIIELATDIKNTRSETRECYTTVNQLVIQIIKFSKK